MNKIKSLEELDFEKTETLNFIVYGKNMDGHIGYSIKLWFYPNIQEYAISADYYDITKEIHQAINLEIEKMGWWK